MWSRSGSAQTLGSQDQQGEAVVSALMEAPDGCTPDCLMDLRLIYHHVAATRHYHQQELFLQAVSWHSLASLNLSRSVLAYSVDQGKLVKLDIHALSFCVL